MADLKISQLTGATTPLAGTEVVPVVQSGATKKVSVANLTTGRAVSALSITSPTITGGTATPLSLQANNITYATIDTSGNFLACTTSASATTNGFKILNVSGSAYTFSNNASTTNSDINFGAYSTGAGAFRFYVGMGGTVYATSTTITAISDQRLKENIQDLDVGLDAVLALKPRKFDWKPGKGKNKKGDRGWIAQEFEQVFPDMIDEWRDPAPEGEEPYKAVNADLIPVLVKALQEMKEIIDAQATRIAALEAK